MIKKINYLLMMSGVLFMFAAHYNNLSYAQSIQPKETKGRIEFIHSLLPTVNSINEDILADREKLLELEEKYKKEQLLLPSEEEWLKNLAEDYRVEYVEISATSPWKKLKERVDAIPPSLAIAQAANESAWGKSRFAKIANNYFGQYCYVSGCGILPHDNKKGEKRLAKKFPDVEEAVRSYINNLNSHKAYEKLRKLRYEHRQKNKSPKGTHLAKGLTLYSTKGKVYVVRITELIKDFNLEKFDKTTFSAT